MIAFDFFCLFSPRFTWWVALYVLFVFFVGDENLKDIIHVDLAFLVRENKKRTFEHKKNHEQEDGKEKEQKEDGGCYSNTVTMLLCPPEPLSSPLFLLLPSFSFSFSFFRFCVWVFSPYDYVYVRVFHHSLLVWWWQYRQFVSSNHTFEFVRLIDWCCFYYFVKNSVVALLEVLCARN